MFFKPLLIGVGLVVSLGVSGAALAAEEEPQTGLTPAKGDTTVPAVVVRPAKPTGTASSVQAKPDPGKKAKKAKRRCRKSFKKSPAYADACRLRDIVVEPPLRGRGANVCKFQYHCKATADFPKPLTGWFRGFPKSAKGATRCADWVSATCKLRPTSYEASSR